MYVIIERKETGSLTPPPPPFMSRLPSPPPSSLMMGLLSSSLANSPDVLLLKFGRIKSIVQYVIDVPE